MTRFFCALALLIASFTLASAAANAQSLNWDQEIPTCAEMVESGFLTFEVGQDQFNWFCAENMPQGSPGLDPFVPLEADRQRGLFYIRKTSSADSVSVSLRVRIDDPTSFALHLESAAYATSAWAGAPENIGPRGPMIMDAYLWVAPVVEGAPGEYRQIWSLRDSPHDFVWRDTTFANVGVVGEAMIRLVVHDPQDDRFALSLGLAHAWVAYNPTRPVSNEDGPQSPSYQVVPNPVGSSGAVIKNLQPGDAWELYDSIGKKVLSGEDRLRPQGLASGLYVMRIVPRHGLPETHRITVVR